MNKGILFSPTLKVQENKVLLIFSISAHKPRHGHILILNTRLERMLSFILLFRRKLWPQSKPPGWDMAIFWFRRAELKTFDFLLTVLYFLTTFLVQNQSILSLWCTDVCRGDCCSYIGWGQIVRIDSCPRTVCLGRHISYPYIKRFHPTSGPQDLQSFPLEFTMGRLSFG